MLIDIDSDEFDKAKENPQKERAISYLIDINFILPTTLPPHRYAVAAYFLNKAFNMNIPFETLKNRQLFSDEKFASNLEKTPLFTLENTEPEILQLGKKYLSQELWTKLLKHSENIPRFVLANAAVFAPRPSTLGKEIITPPTLVELGKQLLNIQEKDKVADFCCGTCQFIISAGQDIPEAEYTGLEIDSEKYAIAKIKTEMLSLINSSKMKVIKEDIFKNHIENPDTKYDKIFSNYPLGLKNLAENNANFYKGYDKYVKEYLDKQDSIFRENISSDWIFNKLVYDSLSENGKAVVIMQSGSAEIITDQNIRKYFIKNHMIETVITLPSKMSVENTNNLTMLVLSHNKNDFVRIIDASKIFTPGRRLNYLSKDNITKIIEALTTKHKYCRDYSIENLLQGECKLRIIKTENKIPFSFSEKDVKYEFRPLSELIKSITRGAHFKAAELDKMATGNIKKDRYLQLSDINNGIVNENLTAIDIDNLKNETTTKNGKIKNYLVKPRNIVLSKNGTPFKVACVSVPKNKRILASGNLYIIDVDESKINPEYLAAYFLSQQGQHALANIAVCTSMVTIGVENLKSMKIPCPPLEIQWQIAKRLKANLGKIKYYSNLIEEAKNEIKQMFDSAQ